MSNDDSVRIAVRVRPLNERERALNSPVCVTVPTSTMVTLTDPNDGAKVHSFSFNYAYDSMDASAPGYASQDTVFADLGTAYLENAWAGYNASIFAYGQTGAGKSYSMTGYGAEEGIIPRGLAEMFRRIDANVDPDLSFRVDVSYLEIYMEKIRDLFNPKQDVASLKVRESAKLGVYVEGLTKKSVTCYADVAALMELGNTLRTVAQTAMNATSSRSHSVLTIILTQTRIDQDSMQASDTVSKINLVDLAGSERQDKTGATGTKLREGSAINQSLSALGNVIEALSTQADSSSKRKRVIPYRNSKLTRILQESLGGNAKTIMVAAISPAADNYKETLSTLRYAFRASKIKNTAVVNESPNDKVIRELKEEVARLKALVAGGGSADASAAGTPEPSAAMVAELEALRAQLAEQNQYIDTLGLSAEDRRAQASAETQASMEQFKSDLMAVSGINLAVDTSHPHLVNLANGSILYALPHAGDPPSSFGSSSDATYTLGGILVAPLHLLIECTAAGTDDVVATARPGAADVALYVNGVSVPEHGVVLHKGDRIVVGNNHFMAFAPGTGAPPAFDRASLLALYNKAMKELSTAASSRGAESAGLDDVEPDSASLVDALESQLVRLMPDIAEANAAAAALKHPLRFAPYIQPALVTGTTRAVPRVFVRYVHVGCDSCGRAAAAGADVALVDADTFSERLFNMKEVYSNFMSFGIADNGGPDPFAPESEVLLGTAYVVPLALSGAAPVSRVAAPILSAHGHFRGRLICSLVPVMPPDAPPVSPAEWLLPGQVVFVRVVVHALTDTPLSHADGLFVAVHLPGTAGPLVTPVIPYGAADDPLFDSIARLRVTDEVIDIILDGVLAFEVRALLDPHSHPLSPFSLRHAAAPPAHAGSEPDLDDLSELSALSDLEDGADLELADDELAALEGDDD